MAQDKLYSYSANKMKEIKEKVQKMFSIVKELEAEFPGRHFTLDGHLVGSIGEVLASYYYGIMLYKSSEPVHDGEVDGKRIQIKITQREDIVIREEPDYLIALYLTKNGDVYEVYNGRGKEPWESASKKDSHDNRHMRINKLMELDEMVNEKDRIQQQHKIEKMKKEYKNSRVQRTL